MKYIVHAEIYLYRAAHQKTWEGKKGNEITAYIGS